MQEVHLAYRRGSLQRSGNFRRSVVLLMGIRVSPFSTFVVLSVLCLLSANPLSAWQNEKFSARYAESLEHWGSELKLQIRELSRLEKLGTVAQGERDFNEAQLAAINFELARLRGTKQSAEQELLDFIAIEQRRLERLEPLRQLNAVPMLAITHVRSGVHFGLFHLAKSKRQPQPVIKHLEEFVKLSEQELECYQSAIRANSVSPCEVSVAHHQLLFSRYLLGKRQNNFDEILPEIRAINARLESDWLAAKKLHEQRLITLLDAYFMELYYLESELLIAAIEGSRDAMAGLLQQRIALHNRVLAKGQEVGWGPTVAIYSQINLENLLSCSSAFDQFLLDRLKATGEFEYESMLLFGL